MARNGAGTYNLPSGNPVVTGSTISSAWANSTLNDMATALTQSISSDGQTTPTGNLPMGGYNHTNVADATVRASYASAGQVQDSAFTFLTSPSGTNTMTAAASLGMSAYVTGQRFFFVSPSTNTSACTLNINAIGAKAITKQGTTALVAGDIVSGAVIQVVYDGTEFQLVSPAGSAVNSFSAGTTGLTPSTATTGAITLAGTLAVANGGTGVTTSTGSGSNVLSTSPALTTPDLGTPSNLVATNASGTANNLNAGIGVNQTWTDVSSSRAFSTNYTNSTGKPIMVYLTISTTGGGNAPQFTVTVNSVVIQNWIYQFANSTNNTVGVNFIVPNGQVYNIAASSNGGGIASKTWIELR